MSTRSTKVDDPPTADRRRARRGDRRADGARVARSDPAPPRPCIFVGVWRDPDRSGAEQRPRRSAKVLGDLRGGRPAVRARQRRLGVPRCAELRREQLRRRQRPRHRRALRQQLCGGGRTDANRDRRRRNRQLVNSHRADPSQPARGSATAERLQRDRRRVRRRDPAQALGRAWGLAGGARGVEQLPARDRPGHTARGASTPTPPRARAAPTTPARRRPLQCRQGGRGAFP